MSDDALIPVARRGQGEHLAHMVDHARLTLVDGVYEAIKALVMDGRIAPGGRVSIDALARDLDVSQTPVREALVRLEADGLVVKRARAGYRTTATLTADQLGHLFELRVAIEAMCARLAAERGTDPQIERICGHSMPGVSLEPGQPYDAYRSTFLADWQFHTLIADASNNPMLRQAWDHTNAHLHLFRLYVPSKGDSYAVAEHRSITDAIAARKPDAAAAAMVEHLTLSRSRLMAGLVGT